MGPRKDTDRYIGREGKCLILDQGVGTFEGPESPFQEKNFCDLGAGEVGRGRSRQGFVRLYTLP